MIGLFWILQMYLIFIGVNILLSWFPAVYQFGFFRVCKRISDWFLGPFQGVLVIGIFDLTPIVGLFLYQFVLQAFMFLVNG